MAGRLCGTPDGNTARWHGLIAWATATLVVFALLTSAEATRKGVAKASILGTIALALGGLAAWFGRGIGVPKREVRTYVR